MLSLMMASKSLSYRFPHRVMRKFTTSTPLNAEESDEKETGHQTNMKMPELSSEDMELVNKFRDHQSNAARLTNAEEVRTLIEYSNGYGVLSTNSKQFDGYPTGSVVGFALDNEGYPFMVFSSMSAHTNDVINDGKVSLTVLANDFKGAAEGRCVLIGEMSKLNDEKKESYREIYMKKHPDAFWIDFGDFSYFKMDSIQSIRYIGGFARAGSITSQDYLKAKADPIAAFASHVMNHMNDDHSDATSAIIKHYVGVPCKETTIVGMDSLGMTVKATMEFGGGGVSKIRVPWEGGRVTERKAIKDVIVKMTQESAKASTE